MLTGISFLLSWASCDTKVENHQRQFYIFIYMVHPILLGDFYHVDVDVDTHHFDDTFVPIMLFQGNRKYLHEC